MYGSNMELPMQMLSYRAACTKHDSITPIRGRSEDVRPLARRSNTNLTISKEPVTNDVLVTLYSTDIVRYRESGIIELDPYPSALTNRIMRSILGPRVSTLWMHRDHLLPDYITEVGGRYYHTPDTAVIQPSPDGWALVDGAKPIEVPRVNKAEAKQALREVNYHTFELWLETRVRLGVAEFGRRFGRSFAWNPQTAVQYLQQGETGWAEIVGRMSSSVSLDAELRALRKAVYRYAHCYDIETFPYFEGYQQMTNVFNRLRRAAQ